jgi:hypothetical protein
MEKKVGEKKLLPILSDKAFFKKRAGRFPSKTKASRLISGLFFRKLFSIKSARFSTKFSFRL